MIWPQPSARREAEGEADDCGPARADLSDQDGRAPDRGEPRRIRAWEDQYNLLSPARTGGGHRLYSEDDVERIRWVKAMVDRGMSLKGIQRLIESTRPVEMAGDGRGSGR